MFSYGHFKALNMGPISILDPNQQGWTSLPILGRSPFMVLDWSHKLQAIWANLAIIIILGPLVTPSKLGPGDQISLGGLQLPHVPSHMGHGLQKSNLPNFKFQEKFPWYGKDQNEPECPKMTSKGHLGPKFQESWGQDPFLDMHIEDHGSRKGLKRLWTILGDG
ncbi:hypothetical protein O181_017164 [Austropuccinia psidii MF-1]|uniref:Uncharacterized protein n=1 Tax=Austropuccinia psidii MF-1 TaxID=1389203 RepID=A0A9Q3C2Z6_9BASI|nr:hypothetical protein [Austropuccinia psidii MF-1]